MAFLMPISNERWLSGEQKEGKGVEDMAYVISIVNQKGGVGKTTTTVNLAAYLAEKRKKTLVIDMDPQGNATSAFGIDKMSLESTIYDVLVNEIEMGQVILKERKKNLDVCPTNINLAGAEIELVSAMSRETILSRAIQSVLSEYAYILIDCPPSLSLLTLNALTSSNGLIVPIQGEYYALEGVTQLMDTINLVKRHLNPDLSIFGVVVTMFDSRTQLAKQVTAEVREYFDEKVFRTVIPRNIRLAEAPSYGKTIAEFDPRSKGGRAYKDLAIEVIKRTAE